jgi:hypothetical protein
MKRINWWDVLFAGLALLAGITLFIGDQWGFGIVDVGITIYILAS